MKILPYSCQSISEEDIQIVVAVLRSACLTQGPFINQFESEFAKKVGAKYAVAVNSGTAALHICYMALGLTTGDELITTPNTFVATANAALYCGATPVFADIFLDTGLIDPAEVIKHITPRTRAISPVDFAGCPADLAAIKAIADRYKLKVIQDASHSLGARYRDSTVGDCAYSDMTVFSFHPVKPITTGEGGMVTTNDETLYNALLKLRTHGITKENLINSPGPWYYEMTDLGYNYRMTDLQAALGSSQLKKLDSFISARRRIASQYNDAFCKLEFVRPLGESPDCESGYHLYVLSVNFHKLKKSRAEVMAYLRERGVGSQVHYIPVYHHPYYREKFRDQPKLAGMEDYYATALSIPIFPTMTDVDVVTVIDAVASLRG